MTDVLGLRQRLDALFEKKIFTNSVVENFKKKGIGIKKKKAKKKIGKKAKAGKNRAKKKTKPPDDSNQTFLQKEFGFRYVTWKSLGTGKGWRNVFNILFFIIPALILFIADKIVNIKILKTKYDPPDSLKYQKYKDSDKLWIYHSGIEFFQIFIAAYIASAFYHLIFIERHRSMETYFRSEVTPRIGFDLIPVLFFGLIFLPRLFYFIIYKTAFRPNNSNNDDPNSKEVYKIDERKNPNDNKPIELDFSDPVTLGRSIIHVGFEKTSTHYTEGLRRAAAVPAQEENVPTTSLETSTTDLEGLKLFLPYKASRTIVYLIFYCVAFFICSFLLSKIATLFLDVFIFKANPIMYIFILLGFLQWFLDVVTKMHINIKIEPSGKETIKVPNPKMYHMFNIAYAIYLFFHFLFALGCAPVAQAIFTLYLLSFMFPYQFLRPVYNYFFTRKTTVETTVNPTVEMELSEYNASRPSSTNDFFYKFIFQNNDLMFSFFFMLFFFWKYLTSLIGLFVPGVGLKIHGLYWALLIINFLLTALCANIYYYFYRKLYPITPLSSTL